FNEFITGLHQNINPNVTPDEAIEMLSQHLITKPVFDALFEGYEFTKFNPVSQTMQRMLDVLEGQSLQKDVQTLEKFYQSVRERASGIDNAEGKQRIIIELYDKFFRAAFPKLVERLGIVYTPVEVVDFIIHSADFALKQEFGVGLSDEGVHILDPFTGTGTFMVRLLQSGLIKREDLQRKFSYELHCNEIVLLAYYIAAINIEEAYHFVIQSSLPVGVETFHGTSLHSNNKSYQPFNGIVLTDTFQM
ncbi:MAG: damage-inducible protein, partial [Dolichospermum sp.]